MRDFPWKKIFITFFIILYFFVLFYFIRRYFLEVKQKKEAVKITPTFSPKPPADSFKVVRVIDGDTIEIENKKIVRLIGVDSPELHHPKKPVQCFGAEAAEFTKKMLTGKTVRLEKDVSETDRYRRLLRYVYIDDPSTSSGQVFFNEYLVSEGYATAATFPPDVKYVEVFKKAEVQARNNNRGLWGKCKTLQVEPTTILDKPE
jgi:micrococcal nuclease